MTFVKALDELKQGKAIYDKRYPNVCYKYTAHNEKVYMFRRSRFSKTVWTTNCNFLVGEYSFGIQEILFDDWDVLDTDNLTFNYDEDY